MNKKTLRIITVIATIMLVLCIGTSVFATTPSEFYSNHKNDTSAASNTLQTVGGKVVGAIQIVAIVVAVVVLMVLGVKYMAGSAEQKAEYKKTFIPYIVGAVLVFAAGTLANMIYQFANNI